jgi:acyl-[acyl carrier protein]--UDP-N-acetylglucosamine O-acyltransferase
MIKKIPDPEGDDMDNIHPTAIVMPGAVIGENVKIGAYSVIGDMARIGDCTNIGNFCEIGLEAGVSAPAPVHIDKNSLIRSGSVIYQGSFFGEGLITGHRVTIRENICAGQNLQIGTLSDLQGHATIGDFARLHSNVHIGQKTHLGNFTWVFPYVVLTNDPHPPSEMLEGCLVEDYAIIATMCTVLPGIRIGQGALVGAMTLVRDDVPADTICVGVPGKNIGSTEKIRFKNTGKAVYPWRRQFHRGYPDHIVDMWRNEFPNG